MKKIIEINSISGLFSELYIPVILEKIVCTNSHDFFMNWNNLFWKHILSYDFFFALIDRMPCEIDDSLSIWEKAVIKEPNLFWRKLSVSPEKITSYSLSQEELFGVLETLTIYCQLLSKYVFSPFALNLQEGIQTGFDDVFSLLSEIVERTSFCRDFMLKQMEPYLERFDFIWINGKLNYANLLAIKELRKINHEVFVGIRYHESEYFSYNKIEEYLSCNYALFNLIDCIVLDSSEETMEKVEQRFSNMNELRLTENILFKDCMTGKIIKGSIYKNTYYTDNQVKLPYISDNNKRIKISPIVNMRLFSNKSCYWNKCAFCGINKKYKYQDIDAGLVETHESAINIIEKYSKIGYTYFWFEDEAVEKDSLLRFSKDIIKKKIKVLWQVRTRLDSKYDMNECKLLYEAGLREIRFGYESGDITILQNMKKYPDDFDYNIIEQNISIFALCGIHVHLPTILGFPTEINRQRQTTIRKLQKLNQDYNVTFNLNRFLLDVSSDVYKHFYQYNIFEICLPTQCDDFIGNFASFNQNNNTREIDLQRVNVMRETLYPWMPETSLLTSVIYYRLSEASRMTLLWASNPELSANVKKYESTQYMINPNLSIILSDNEAIIYNWDNHRIFSFERELFDHILKKDYDHFTHVFIQELYEKKILV